MKKAMRFTAAVILLVFILSGCNNINPALSKSSAPEESETIASSDTALIPTYMIVDRFSGIVSIVLMPYQLQEHFIGEYPFRIQYE